MSQCSRMVSDMTSRKVGRSTIDYLLRSNKLEELVGGDAEISARGLLSRANLRITTAQAGLDGGDPEGAFVAAYDAYRMAADSLLVRQGLRATGGPGSHAVAEDAISAQFSDGVHGFAKPTFERFRRTRNAAQYFDPDAPEIVEADASWAIRTATEVVDGVGSLLSSETLSLYRIE